MEGKHTTSKEDFCKMLEFNLHGTVEALQRRLICKDDHNKPCTPECDTCGDADVEARKVVVVYINYMIKFADVVQAVIDEYKKQPETAVDGIWSRTVELLTAIMYGAYNPEVMAILSDAVYDVLVRCGTLVEVPPPSERKYHA